MSQYLKPDSELGYIEDQAEIESLKINNLRHVILGCMLGDFDETGAYVVEPEIVKELIEMPKYIVESIDNIEICKSTLKLDKQITFMVTFEGNKATLTLVEKLSYEANYKINSGTYSNINEYVLDTVETSGEVNRNAIYSRWNIGNFGGNVIDIFNCDEEILEKYFGIVNRFKYLLHTNKVLIEKEETIEEIESAYANEIFEILKHYPKLQDAVMKQVKETLNEKKEAISITKPNFAKTFNEVLENAIQSNINELNDKEKEEFNSEKRNATVNLNVKRAEVLETESVDIDNDVEAELSPKVVRLKTSVIYSSQSITELGEEFITAHKNLENKKKVEQGQSGNETERNKLIATLVGVGLGVAIGGVAGAVVGATTGNLVAEAAEKLANAKNDKTANTANTKKAQANKGAQNTRGNTVNKGGSGSSGGGGQRTNNSTKPKNESQDKDKKEEIEEQESYFPTMPTRTVGNKLEQETVVAPKLSEEEMMKMENEVVKVEQERLVTGQVNTNKIVAGKVKTNTIVAHATTAKEETSILTDL